METKSYDTQEEINYGQARINFELVRVDEKLIESLNALVTVLNTAKQDRSAAPALRQMDLSQVIASLEEAAEISGKVADIKPPGCEEPYPS